MKRLMCALFVLAAISYNSLAGQVVRPKVAVLRFQYQASYSWGYGDPVGAATDAITDIFVRTGKFEIIERSQLENLLSEQELSTLGITASDTGLLGKIKTVDYAVVGTIPVLSVASELYNWQDDKKNWHYETRTKVIAEVSFRLVDVKSGSVVYSGKKGDDKFHFTEGNANPPAQAKDSWAKEQLTEACAKFFNDVYNLIPVYGYIIKVVEEDPKKGEIKKVLVDLGSDHAILKGLKFDVLREGEGIVHPVTGEKIPGEAKVIGELQVESVDGQSISTTKVKEGKKVVKIGDKIKSKPI